MFRSGRGRSPAGSGFHGLDPCLQSADFLPQLSVFDHDVSQLEQPGFCLLDVATEDGGHAVERAIQPVANVLHGESFVADSGRKKKGFHRVTSFAKG